MKRRKFIKGSGAFCFFASMDIMSASCLSSLEKHIKIAGVSSAFEKEPLIRPFGFKGGYLTELWQTVVSITSANNKQVIGVGTQSVLWSDSEIFATNSEEKGNLLMYDVTRKALEIINGQSFKDPITFLESIIDEVYEYGKLITGKPNLRKTFILNALVPVDNAIWLLYAQEHGISNFDDMIPAPYRTALNSRQNELAIIPLITYNTPIEMVQKNAEEGAFFFKIKLGQPGTQQEMLEKDIKRLSEIHQAVGAVQTPYTDHGKVLYYLDANGRYETKQAIQQFIEYAKKIDALEQIALIEEPFPEDSGIDVSDLGVTIAADENAHTDSDVLRLIKMGYKAIALKPIAKTLSMTLKILKVATKYNISYFCADLTVNPVLVEWNKNIAARLSVLPKVKVGLLETNGNQNYKNWDQLCFYDAAHGKSWTKVHETRFALDNEFYTSGGGIFTSPEHYKKLVDS